MKKPDIEVKDLSRYRNSYALMGFVSEQLKKAGNSQKIITDYINEAANGTYNHCVAVSVRYVKGLAQ